MHGLPQDQPNRGLQPARYITPLCHNLRKTALRQYTTKRYTVSLRQNKRAISLPTMNPTTSKTLNSVGQKPNHLDPSHGIN